jgi:hypothetical protein
LRLLLRFAVTQDDLSLHGAEGKKAGTHRPISSEKRDVLAYRGGRDGIPDTEHELSHVAISRSSPEACNAAVSVNWETGGGEMAVLSSVHQLS